MNLSALGAPARHSQPADNYCGKHARIAARPGQSDGRTPGRRRARAAGFACVLALIGAAQVEARPPAAPTPEATSVPPPGNPDYAGPPRFYPGGNLLRLASTLTDDQLALPVGPRVRSPKLNYAQPDVGPTPGNISSASPTAPMSSTQRAICSYGGRHTLYFWHRSRPELSEAAIKGLVRFGLFADAAIDLCPATYGDALTLAIGPDFKQRVQLAIQKDAEEAPARRAQAELDRARTTKESNERIREANEREQAEVAKVAQWRAGAVPAGAARDAELLNQLRAEVNALRNGSAYRGPQFATDLQQRLLPVLTALGRSVYAQGLNIGAGASGRKAFDAWDRGTGGHALLLMEEMSRSWPDNREMDRQVHVITAEVWRLYRDHVDDKGTLDPAFRARIDAGLARLRAARADAPARPAPATEVVRRTETRVIYLRPSELVAYQIAAGAVAALNARGQAVAFFNNMEAEMRSNRTLFWDCYAKGCADPAPLFLRYSQLLKDKDSLMVTREIQLATMQKLSRPEDRNKADGALNLMGSRVIDGGPNPHCVDLYDKWLFMVNEWAQKRALNSLGDPAAVRAFAEQTFQGEQYEQVQQCRDLMEFAFRTRD